MWVGFAHTHYIFGCGCPAINYYLLFIIYYFFFILLATIYCCAKL